jgi:branched-chain amino acid transport system substrate-binding protein
MKQNRSMWVMGTVAFLTMFFVILGTPVSSNSEDKIVIGIVNSMSGFGADMGLAGRQGTEIALKEINGAGGVNGKQIELIERDDEGNPQKGVSAVNELIFKEGVKVIMGMNLTHVSNAVNKIINDQKILFLTMGTGSILTDPKTYPYTFRLIGTTDDEAKIIVKYFTERYKGKKIGMINDSTAYGKTGYGSVQKAVAQFNVNLTGHEIYNSGDTDMTPQVLKLKGSGAETVILWGVGPDLAQLTQAFARIKWDPVVACGIGVHAPQFADLANKEVASQWLGTMHRSFTYPKGGSLPPAIQKFDDMIKAKWGSDTKSYVPNAGIWYDMINLYAKAVSTVKSQDPDAIKKFIEGIGSYKGLVATYTYGPDKHDGFNYEDLALAYVLRGNVFGKERAE